MTLYFTKMHGLGNDFMVINAISQTVILSKEDIIALARRDTGIGFDQCLLVETSNDKNIDFFYRIFNANGQEVGQCGNGARCLARFIHQQQLTNKKDIKVATKTTQMRLIINDNNSVTVDFGYPSFKPCLIPLQVDVQKVSYFLPCHNGEYHQVHAVNVGNPHAVMVVEDLFTTDVTNVGREISEHPLFPEQCNAGFMKIINSSQIKLRVYERGCGETMACGSGAVAAYAVGRLYHHLDDYVEVVLPGGNLIVEWPPEKPIFLTGPAQFVYEGHL
jgi:diaminopimelate epimerase